MRNQAERAKYFNLRFPAKRYVTDGCSFEEAIDTALQAALARRQELVDEGDFEDKDECKKVAPSYRSIVHGVIWRDKERR